MTSLREKKKAEVRARVVETCGSLFRTQGFDETTIDDIITAAQISRQTFFNYFKGKEAVLAELGLMWLQEQADFPRRRFRKGQGGSILKGTRRAILEQMRAIKSDRAFMRLVFTRSGFLFAQAGQTGVDKDKSGTGRRQINQIEAIFEALETVMAAAQEAGEIRPDITPRQVAEIYATQMVMTAHYWLTNMSHKTMDLEVRAKHALDVIEAGLKPQ